MPDNEPLLTGNYQKKLSEQVSRIEKHAKGNMIRRAILFCLLIAVAVGGILFGISFKTNAIEEQYQLFAEMPDRNIITPELLSYKDTYSLFVEEYLGNDPFQSIMGGYFYSNDSYLIYPNNDATRTLINLDGREYVMAAFLADNINVRQNCVFYRNPLTRSIYSYDIASRKTSMLDFSDVGQFVVCGDDYYYIDLCNTSLVQYSSATLDKKTIVENGASSFAVAGNELIILNTSHTLSSYNLSNDTTSILCENVIAFSFNGTLWIQNDTAVYQKRLDDTALNMVELGLQCNRLLGATASSIVFEAEDGVYVYDIITKSTTKIGTELLVGISGNKVLWFSLTDNNYKLEIE